MFSPGRYNISIIQGTTFSIAPIWQIDNLPVNITGYSADMQVRDVSGNLITEISTANGRATINGALGQTTLTLTAAQTGALAVGNYTYAFNLTDTSSNVYQILNGSFVVQATVIQ